MTTEPTRMTWRGGAGPGVLEDLEYGPKWLRSMGKQLSPEGERVAALVNWLFDGIYHEQAAVMRADWSGRFVELHLYSDLSSFDAARLTRLVVGAHDAAIRVEISACNSSYIRVRFHPRDARDGPTYARHPRMEDALSHMARLPVYE